MSANSLLPFIGWTFIPNLVSGWIQTIYYGLMIRVGDPKPQPGSPRYVLHRRRILITVIIAYLLYTLYEADYQLRRQGDFYQSLGVPHNVEDRGIKSRFRRLAATHHPDKVTSEQDRAMTEAYFVHLKLAQDTLLNPVKRFAYDRFGPEMISWEHCSTVRGYLLYGLRTYAPTYIGAGIMLVILGVTGYLQWGRFWRYLFAAALLLLEIYVATRPYHPPFLKNIINPFLIRFAIHPPLLPFELMVLARKATLALFIAFSQLGPLLQPRAPVPSSSDKVDPQQLQRLEHMARANEVEATRLLGLDMAPFAGDEQGVKDLRGKVKEWLVQNTIRNDPEIRDAVGRALGRRRVGAPTGARVTRIT